MKAYMARQPIYAAAKSIFGYELLYRGAISSSMPGFDGEAATKTVVSDAVMAFGLERLTNGKPAFINFGRILLLSDLIDMLDKDNFVIEILEDTVVDDELVAHIKQKSEEGYNFALDDYVGDPAFDPLLPYVNIVKVDFVLLRGRALRKVSERLLREGKILLAEKIETLTDYEIALGLGYTLFQGYYFEKPIVISTTITDVQSSTCALVFNELSKPTLDFSKLANIVRNDVNLTYKLMRHSNSLQYYRGNEVTSVRTALVNMGAEEIKRWITLIFMRDLGKDETDENTKDALVRALLAEWTAKKIGLNGDVAFLTGMFSMIDVITSDSFANVLGNLAVSQDIKDALLGMNTPYGSLLSFVCGYESGDWDEILPFATLNRLPMDALSRVFLDSVKYADDLFNIEDHP